MGTNDAASDAVPTWAKAVIQSVIVVGILLMWGPLAVLWSFWAEAVGLTAAWIVMMVAGTRPFSMFAIFSVPALILEFISLEFLAAMAQGDSPTVYRILQDPVERWMPLALGAAAALAWCMPDSRPRRIQYQAETRHLVPMKITGRRRLPNPLVMVGILHGGMFVAMPIAAFVGFLFILLWAASGDDFLIRHLFEVPAWILAILIGTAQVLIDLGIIARKGPVLHPQDAQAMALAPPFGNTAYAPPGGTGRLHCANCMSPNLKRVEFRSRGTGLTWPTLTCLYCGASNRVP